MSDQNKEKPLFALGINFADIEKMKKAKNFISKQPKNQNIEEESSKLN